MVHRLGTIEMSRPVVSTLVLVGAFVAFSGRVAVAADSEPASFPSASLPVAPGDGATSGGTSDSMARRFLRLDGPRFLFFGLRLYRGDERLNSGFFCGTLPTLVLGSKDGELHARRARTARIVSFSFAMASLAAVSAGAVTFSAVDTTEARSVVLTATLAGALGFMLVTIYAGETMSAEFMRAINAYNYDLVRGSTRSP